MSFTTVMKYYLSVDGGGTKTAFLLTDRNGAFKAKYITSGCTYSVMGKEKIFNLLKEGIKELLHKAEINQEQVMYAVWGIPCYGEYEIFDYYIKEKISLLLSCPNYFCNDVEIGMAGSLCLNPGIHIVAGTGAIVMGKDFTGRTARANGWHEEFSDEGSAGWLGRETLSLFMKQADFRETKGPLYELVRQKFELQKDIDIVSYYQKHIRNAREKLAAIQMILLQAAKEGDESAVLLYQRAAKELADTVIGVCRQLDFSDEKIMVSYSGGVFKSGEFLITPLKKYLQNQNQTLLEPKFSPLSGGILLAEAKSQQNNLETVVENLTKYEREDA